MTLKLVHEPLHGQSFVVGGRRRPVSYNRRIRFGALATPDLPPPPSSTGYETAAMTALRKIACNDTLGCCVISGRAHRIGILTANAGAPFVYTDAQVIAEYSRIGGYVVGNDATDQGCDMSSAADDGCSHGYADGSHDAGWIDVDATNKLEVMQALYLFEDGDLGVELPDAWISPFPSGDDFVWDVAGDPNPNQGHCIELVDFDITRGVRVSTWGMLGWITWPALAKYGARSAWGELIIHINADQITRAAGKAPNGFDWSALVTYFDQMGGRVPIPAPQPQPAPLPPPPAPGPFGSFTPEIASQVAKSALDHGPRVMSRSMAEKLVAKAFASYHP